MDEKIPYLQCTSGVEIRLNFVFYNLKLFFMLQRKMCVTFVNLYVCKYNLIMTDDKQVAIYLNFNL